MKKTLIAGGVIAVAVGIGYFSYTSGLLGENGEKLGAAAVDSKYIVCQNPIFSKLCSITGSNTLTIGQLVISADGATNTNNQLVTLSNQSTYSNAMKLSSGEKSVTIGISNAAGGYINFFGIKGFGKTTLEGKNLDNAGYGQGWQSTIRDELHNLRYNPAIVGFTGYRLGKNEPGAGTPVEILDSRNSAVIIRQANAPLYQGEGKGYDFTQYEDLAKDNAFNDLAINDADGLQETGDTQDSEIRSEFDYTGSYTNLSNAFGIPAMRHDFLYAYMRNPKAILQFTNPRTVDDEGNQVYVDNRRMLDMSPSTPGNQTASSTDLSGMLPTYSVRTYPEDFTAVMWTEGGVWKSAASSPRGTDRIKVASCNLFADIPGFQYVSKISSYALAKSINCHVDDDLILMATDSNPDTAFAVGLYVPQAMSLNAKQTWIVDKTTMSVVTREDRRLEGVFNSTGGYTIFRELTAGLRSPLALAAAGLTHHFEMYTMRTYVLFGTPNEIKAAVAKFKQSKQYAADAAQ